MVPQHSINFKVIKSQRAAEVCHHVTHLESLSRAQERLLVKVQTQFKGDFVMLEVPGMKDDRQGQRRWGV